MRMDNAMLVRGMAERTREAYRAAVVRLARHYRRPPDQLSPQEVQAYLVHMLRDEKLAWSTCSIAVHAFRFLYHTTLGRRAATFPIPGAKQPQRLPESLSPGEVRRLLESTATRKQRALLATTYGAGLRVSEVVRLQLHHLDAARGSLRVEQGKGAKDRDTLLSPRLLAELRAYWREYRPTRCLFPGRDGKQPMNVSTAQQCYTAAKQRAGFTKRGGIQALRHAPPGGGDRPPHDPAAPGPRRSPHHHALPPPGPADDLADDVPVGLAGPADAPAGLAGDRGARDAPE